MSIGGIGVRLVESADAWQILFYRSLALIATLLVVVSYRNRGGLLNTFRAAGPPAVVAGLSLSIAFCGFIFSLGYTTVANTLFVLAASPFLAAVLGLLVLGEAVRRAPPGWPWRRRSRASGSWSGRVSRAAIRSAI